MVPQFLGCLNHPILCHPIFAFQDSYKLKCTHYQRHIICQNLQSRNVNDIAYVYSDFFRVWKELRILVEASHITRGIHTEQ